MFELYGAEIAQRCVQPLFVVDLVDEAREVGGDILERLVGGQVDKTARDRDGGQVRKP